MTEQPIPAGGFHVFTDEPEDESDAALREAREAQEKIEDMALAIFGSGQGKLFLDYLRSRTEKAPGFQAEMGLLNGIAWGFAREGQNSIVRHIEVLMNSAIERK